MNKCYLQLWEHSKRNVGLMPDGCSIHICLLELDRYVNELYIIRQGESIPDEYERILGLGAECFISDSLFSLLSKKSTIRLMEYEMRNLIELQEIIIK